MDTNKILAVAILNSGLLLTACGGGSGSNNTATTSPTVPPITVPDNSLGAACPPTAPVRLNEAVSSNSVFEDIDGDTPDWFELYHCGEEAIDLSGWTLTDDIEEPDQWGFPDGYMLQAKSYLRLWASKKDDMEGDFHTNFKISSSGETLYLYDDSGSLIDSLLVENVPADNSIGVSNQAGEVVYFAEPTPGLQNSFNINRGTITQAVEFSHQGGPTSALTLELSGNTENQQIRYTLDATEPDESALLYSQPIVIDETTVIRAQIIQPEYLSSRIYSRSYLVDVEHDLPVVTLITAPDNFFDAETGIYVFGDEYEESFPFFGANFWQDIEKPINLGLYEESGQGGLNIDVGVKIFGGWSRGNAQRSLSLFARGRYGEKEIDYPVFPELEYDTFQALVLRNSGNDWLISMLRDGLMTQLMRDSGVDIQAYRPVATYLNGQYWGMYNLREKINEHFVASKHDVDIDELDIVEKDGEVIHGSADDYLALVDYLSTHSLVGEEEYSYIKEQVDIDAYIRYQLAQIYFNNTDWPGNNLKFWKAKDGQWRWVLFDTDFGFGIWNEFDYLNNTLAFALDANGPEWPNPAWSTLLFRKLIENDGFRLQFINQFADELNSRFLPTEESKLNEEMASHIATEIPAHFERWQGAPSSANWLQEIDKMKRFGNERPAHVFNHIASQFQLSGTHTIRIDNLQHGAVELNSLLIDVDQWTGTYFEGIAINLAATPNDGYVFSHWQIQSLFGNEDAEQLTDLSIRLNLTQAMSVTPVFIQQ